jgi:hypothetical protein
MRLFRTLFSLLVITVLLVLVPAAMAQTAAMPNGAAYPITLPAKVIAISVCVYGVLQALKKLSEAMGYGIFSGKLAIVWNIVLSALGVIAVADPGQLLSFKFLIYLATTVAGAAGVHGLTGNFYSKPDVQKIN